MTEFEVGDKVQRLLGIPEYGNKTITGTVIAVDQRRIEVRTDSQVRWYPMLWWEKAERRELIPTMWGEV